MAIETGVPNLELILGGLIPEGDTLLVVGAPGTGKTTLALQIAFRSAAAGQRVLYVSTFSEPPGKLLQHMTGFSFYDEALIGKELVILGLFPAIAQGLREATDALTKAVEEHQASLLILDGLMTIRDLYPESRELRVFIYELGSTLATMGSSLILTSSGGPDSSDRILPEFTMADGVIELGLRLDGTRAKRTLRTTKLRGRAILTGEHSLRIGGTGIQVFPRIESVFSHVDVALSSEREPLGFPEVDEMMAGGPPRGSVTLLAGGIGTGKTLACIRFLLSGVERGQKGIVLSFRESPSELVGKARSFGMDLESAVRDGRVLLLHRAPVDMDLNEVAWTLREELQRQSPSRVAIDGFDALEELPLDAGSSERGRVVAIAGLLRAKGVTTLVTKSIPQAVGPELDFSGTPIEELAENVILLRYVEFQGELYRLLSVLKMRDSIFDPSIRQYAITGEGMAVVPRSASEEGLLSGISRLSSEARVKR